MLLERPFGLENLIMRARLVVAALLLAFSLVGCAKLTPIQKKTFISPHNEVEYALLKAATDQRYSNWLQEAIMRHKVYLINSVSTGSDPTDNDGSVTPVNVQQYFALKAGNDTYVEIFSESDRAEQVFGSSAIIMETTGCGAFEMATRNNEGITLNHGLLPEVKWTVAQAKAFITPACEAQP